MKAILFSQHAQQQARERGTNEDEMRQAIREGEQVPAKKRRIGYRLNLPFGRAWGKETYETKQVIPIVADEGDRLVVVTVYVFHF